MTTHGALQEVETLEFSARLNLASNLRLFYLAASREAAVGVLAAGLRHDPDGMGSVLLTRILDLSRVTVDPRYRHPSDAALAVYLWLLGQSSPLGAVAAEVIAQTPQCWWASRVAAPILEQGPTTNEARGEVADTVLAAVQSANTATFEILGAVGQGPADTAPLGQVAAEQAPTTNEGGVEAGDTVLAAVQNTNTASFEILGPVGQDPADTTSHEQSGESSESLALAGLVRARSRVTRLSVLAMAA
jgi:hypothetical protein